MGPTAPVHAQRNSLSVRGIVPRADAVPRNSPFHEVSDTPFGIFILTIRLTIFILTY